MAKNNNDSPLDSNKENRHCNMCGNKLDLWDMQEDFSIRRKLGYGTKYDEDILDFQICCDCMEMLIDKCAIFPIETGIENK